MQNTNTRSIIYMRKRCPAKCGTPFFILILNCLKLIRTSLSIRSIPLEERGKQTQEVVPSTLNDILWLAEQIGDLPAKREAMFEIAFDILYRFAIRKEHTILKMVIQAPEIEVDCSTQCDFIIANNLLRMAESWRIFKDSHAVDNEPLVVRTGNAVYDALIRNPRCHDANIHTAFCCKAHHAIHLIRDNQIRSANPHVSLCRRDDIQIDVLANVLRIKWTIAIGLHKRSRFFGRI